LGRNTPITANKLMNIVTNYAASEEAVGAIFGGDQDKGKHKDEEPEGSNQGSKRNNNAKPRLTTLSLLLTARSLEAPRRGHF
jgi:hypothetical protein